jgi:NADPH-dependent 2,4-dienoyl-CoA reductase/sulfur reductase-like enzyme
LKAEPRIVVIGGVAAGMSAASQARRRNPEAQLVVFERGDQISYGACGMPYNIADPQRVMDDLVVLTPEQARDDRGIELHLGHEVVSLDPEAAEVVVRDLEAEEERREPYHALIIATGARATQLRFPGNDLPGVVALRTLDDGRQLRHLLEDEPTRAVIVGGGYIGMEMAHVLVARGLHVTVLEKMPQILPGWHPETVARVDEVLRGHGVEVLTGVSLTAAEAGQDGSVKEVVTDAGHIAADLMLVAAGVQPNVELATDAGLRLGETGAIWVNQYQQTSNPAIWAAGDCAESYHRILRKNAWIPLGTTANKQGRIAGANAVGGKQRFRGIVGTAGFVVFDQEVARTGLSPEQARSEGFEPELVTIRQRSRAHAYPGGTMVQVTLIADGPSGLLLGAEITGKEGAALRINTVATALAAHLSVADLQGLDLAYAPPFAPVWDPLLVAANQLIKKVGRAQ